MATQKIRTMLEENEEWQKAQRGELYVAFVPDLIAVREHCAAARDRFNTATDRSRRNMVKLWREITLDLRPLPSAPAPAPLPSSSSHPTDPSSSNTTTTAAASDDDALFSSDPWVMAPVHADYGYNVRLGPGVFINFNATFIDTCPITIGARTLVGPNVSFYTGRHPLDPGVRRGLEGPETGAPIDVGEDCWIGGNVVILPGVTVGRGATAGAGSVVTKDVPPFHVVAGNPARILRKIESTLETQDATT